MMSIELRGHILAIGALSMMAVLLVLVFVAGLPESTVAQNLIFTVAGGVISNLNTVMNFAFGSSQGSRDKDKAAAESAK